MKNNFIKVKCILTSIFLLNFFIAVCQSFPVTAEILRQTYQIQTDTTTGSCFLIELNNNDYIVTAKHLFKKGVKNNDIIYISIFRENEVQKLEVQYLCDSIVDIDIAVLKIQTKIQVMKPFNIGENIALGQDVYFLGFPSFGGNVFYTDGYGRVLPLVKKAIVSGWNKNKGWTNYILDGHNNLGFSGGPVVFLNNQKNQVEILGVVSGYYIHNNYVKENKIDFDKKYVEKNSGLIVVYGSDVIKRIINQ